MTLYREAEMQMFFADQNVSLAYPCQVSLSGSSISISYRHGLGHAIYRGEETEPGHFNLRCDKPKGRATLHRFSGDERLEGSYVEEGSEGMWRIDLNEPHTT